ncbi:sensor histidine kinase [Cronobacter sakazakii]|uniref:sensor histidine kinase n=1 Tax=Cronobacter sakazakii TaxID=28141 RepID=UPI002895C29F|nr:ATP-binding protein [Cronobacter sakazakii]ELY3847469.1 sensor histidine kinase [Cronobacter sakazakii]ELY4199220.1 sensor histidine kinase [Cronobacter sakazakii]ELY4420117.1 sensor histidine kinase [Cronobacter sakazakii]MDT3631200.1 ATP-binding protein [Cronobacter sakazakii]
MKNLSPFVVWDLASASSIDGTFFHKLAECNKRKAKDCQKYYSTIASKKGFHTCPAGLTSYSTGEENQKIYTAFKAAGYYDVTKTKKIEGFLPTIPPIVVIQSINKEFELQKELTFKKSSVDGGDEKADKELIDFSIHEVRKFNGEIKRISEEILNTKDISTETLKSKVKSIFASSSLISVRLSTYDIEENPQLLDSQGSYSAGIYKKFQKASHCLENFARDRQVKILSFKGKSHHEIQIYPFFDFVPFVILENAIKYSPPNQDIEVKFDEISKGLLEVSICSTGPYNTPEEMEHIFDKKVRGTNATLVDNTGGGYGLYFAKLVCDLHNIEMKAWSNEPTLQFNGVNYSEFLIKISISF